MALIKKHLESNYTKKGKRWQVGPTKLTSADLAKVFTTLSFWFVYCGPSPVAMHPNTDVSVCLSIDAKGKIAVVNGRTLFNGAAFKISDKVTAKTAAAAVMCLTRTVHGWKDVTAEEVTAKKTNDGWACSASLGEGQAKYLYTVSFAKGKCTAAHARYTGMLPKCNSPMTMIPYEYSYTFDILPSSKNGTYWANGIHFGSTIMP